MPEVSVIITTYNRCDSLKKTINSVLNQTFQDFELIVVDNFSNYDFLKVINAFNDKRIIAFQKNNRGIIAKNRNYGISKANGAYIAFCDDDDIWESNKLEIQINFIYRNKLENDQFVLYTNCIEVNDDSSKRTSKKEIQSIDDFIYSNQISFSTSLISNISLKETFNELPVFVGAEDYLFWMSLKIKNYNFFLIEEHLVKIHVDKSSMSLKNYGVNHVSTVLALVYIYLNHKNLKINNFSFGISIIRQFIKFIIKKTIIIKAKN